MNGFPPNGPTGIVCNNGPGFLIPTATGMVESKLIFANLNGQISAWNAGSTAGVAGVVVAVDDSTTSPPPKVVYTGLAINGSRGSLLYAANFNAGGGIEVYNSDWSKNTSLIL